ncbi:MULTISPECIES: DUF4255 domain-containing protein [Rhodococcus]|uniref:DUF4255 domain-containing protein n=1 Tax=Rhodococcus TaxID=1827 RepID=UPI001F1253C7|nr:MULTISPECIES: DUF4255 domain-containing protein [Rhodococcus]
MVAVISDVDAALRQLIEHEAIDDAEVDVVFDAPTKDWAARRTGPTIDVYLYDIREDLRRRQRGLVNEYDNGLVRARHLPPRYFKLSYLVAAWTQRPEDEHHLLGRLLTCFLRHDALPGSLLSGSLADLGLPVPVAVALPPPEDRSFADVWTALGGELKPSLDLVVSMPTPTGRVHPAAPPALRTPRLSTEGKHGSVSGEQKRRRAPAPDGSDPVPSGLETLPEDAPPADGESPSITMRKARRKQGRNE